MMGTKSRAERANILARKIYCYSHDTAHDMRRLLKLSGKNDSNVEASTKKVVSNCATCIRSGLSVPSCKLSIKHIDKDFNQTVIVDFFFFKHGVPGTLLTFLHSQYTVTVYSETSLASKRDMDVADI